MSMALRNAVIFMTFSGRLMQVRLRRAVWSPECFGDGLSHCLSSPVAGFRDPGLENSSQEAIILRLSLNVMWCGARIFMGLRVRFWQRFQENAVVIDSC